MVQRESRNGASIGGSMMDFTGQRYVEVDSEQAGTPEYVAWLEFDGREASE